VLFFWHGSALDPQATDDLMLSIEPQHVMDLAPLYTELNQVLTEAGVADEPTLRIRREVERFSSQAPLAPASHSAAPTVTQHPNFLPHQAMAHPHALGHTLPSAASSAPSAWQGLAPVGRSLAAQARQFLQRLLLPLRGRVWLRWGEALRHRRGNFCSVLGWWHDLSALPCCLRLQQHPLQHLTRLRQTTHLPPLNPPMLTLASLSLWVK